MNEEEKMTKNRKMQTPASREEADERMALMQTRGRKGVHLPRINMAFTPENHDFIKTMSVVTCQTMTEYLNDVIKQYREVYSQDYDEIIKMRERMNTIMSKYAEQNETNEEE